MVIKEKDGDLLVTGVDCLSLDLSLDCGQAFRWRKADGAWHGVAYGTPLAVRQEGDTLIFENTSRAVFEAVWRGYFDLDRDYAAVCDTLCQDSLIAPAVQKYYGIRVLRQESWEALCSFVISQQNNINRIKGIVARLCETYGDAFGGGDYAFPTAAQLSAVSEEEFRALGAGYRAKYLVALSRAVADGTLDLEGLRTLPMEEARAALLRLYGVGVKVADCALLFGFGFDDAFPQDVWMKRVMQYYPDGLPSCFDGVRGIAQQYLFHQARENGLS